MSVLHEVALFIILGACLPLCMSLFWVDNRFTALITLFVQCIIPYGLFIQIFRRGLKKGYSNAFILWRTVLASIIWSVALYLKQYSYVVFDPLKSWLGPQQFYYGPADKFLSFVYWSFFLVGAVLLSDALASMTVRKDQGA